MNPKTLLLVTLLSFFFITGFSNINENKKAMWIENLEAKNTETLLNRAKENGFNVLYVRIDQKLNNEYFDNFIQKASEINIQVHALGGEPSWALEENQQQILDFIQWVKAYNKGVSKEGQFDGVHLSIQPQYLSKWYDEQTTVIAEWKHNLTATVDSVPKDSQLELSISIPFWLDEVETPGKPDTPFNTWLIRQFDHTTILAYRDTLEGPNGIVNLTKSEFEVADQYNKQIIVGVTLGDTGQDHTSFFEEGIPEMNMHLNLVDQHLGEYDSYVGTAVDDYSSWKSQKEQPSMQPKEEKEYRGTYIWEAEQLIQEKDQTIQFMKEKNINLLYTRLDLTQPFTAYSSFVEEANAAGIEVHAMGGHPSWALKEESSRILKLVDYVKQYNNSVNEKQKFSGIHLDIEPYVTQSWDENKRDVLSQWMDNIQLFVQETKRNSKLETSMDLAMWFDDTETPGHSDTPFNEWVINQMDHTSVMAFRDYTKGSGGIIDMAQNEVDYAESINKNIIVSVELKENRYHPQISFHEEGKAEMEEQLDILSAELSSNSGYKGYSVHAYRYWNNP